MHFDTRFNRTGLIVILVLLLLSIAGYAYLTFRGDVNPAFYSKEIKAVEEEVQTNPENDPMGTEEDGSESVVGYVVDIRKMEGSPGTWIKIAPALPEFKDGKVPNADQKESIVVPASGTEYAFFLSDKETIGGRNVSPGDQIVVSFRGTPSVTDYILADKVEIRK